VVGSIITLVAGILTALVGKFIKNKALKIIVGGFFPVVLNALLLPLIWLICYGVLEYVYYLQALLIFLGQAVAIYGVGSVVFFSMEKIIKKRGK
jgi:hypothetical protein